MSNGCWHDTVVPVEVDGEVVALLCTECLDRLPPNHGCTDCGWCVDTRLGQMVPTYLPTRYCRAHAYADLYQ